MSRNHLRWVVLAAAVASFSVASTAAAFCGFYVSGADASLFNNATNVVLMREGRRTILSMQNNYQGPPEDFALVIPVPQVLQEENVKTLPNEVFDRVDQMAAPRLVEYWEQDPCNIVRWEMEAALEDGAVPVRSPTARAGGGTVRIEAQFEVGEYEIVVLSSDDSTALDTWLRQNNYQIPEGAGPLFRPYIESGMFFFVAKVNIERVQFNDEGQAMLSPLRFHYDSDDFQLPIRLGLINSSGSQDLLVHILARGQRYQVANYTNVTIPTNIDVSDDVKANFGSFYAALFDRTIERFPRAVVTEYSWDASTCDPCPGPTLTFDDFATLGADVLGGSQGGPTGFRGGFGGGFVLTRLHLRYTADDISEDLVFAAAPPIVGGRGTPSGTNQLSQEPESGSMNNFQGRYIIKHRWDGPIACQNPQRGVWGGPPNGAYPGTVGASNSPTTAKDTAFADRDAVQLASVVQEDIPSINFEVGERRANAGSGTQPSPTNGAESQENANSDERSDSEQTSDNADDSVGSESSSQSSSKKNCSSAPFSSSLPIALILTLGFVWKRRDL